MGISSTPFFHDQVQIRHLLSFEDDPQWMKCDKCITSPPKSTDHYITPFESDPDKLRDLVTGFLNPHTTIALVDGPHLQRIKMLQALQTLRVPYIIEHDSESLPPDELLLREEIARSSGYNLVHYTVQNPESILYSISSVIL